MTTNHVDATSDDEDNAPARIEHDEALDVLAGNHADDDEDDIALTAYTSWAESVRRHMREEYISDFPSWREGGFARMLIEDERARRTATTAVEAELLSTEPF